jgi:diguanylate cyclase (GGDEF)-like protein/PAS domain S-box-containing protein
MNDHSTLLKAALDNMPDGVAVFDAEGCVVFWNAAAEAITGYGMGDFGGGTLPTGLNQLVDETARMQPNRGMTVRTQHKLGHELAVIARSLVLRDDLDGGIGTAVLFHPAERLDALPHGESGIERSVTASQQEFEERLYAEFEDFLNGGEPFGILWIGVDQGQNLRKTHGAAACHAMLDKVQRALASGIRPAEELSRWGEDEFLILAHERTAEMLMRHGCALAGMARTADFRWWGDRVSLTVSVGAAQANRREPLRTLLERAREGQQESMREGGNRVKCVPGEGNHDGEESICTRS